MNENKYAGKMHPPTSTPALYIDGQYEGGFDKAIARLNSLQRKADLLDEAVGVIHAMDAAGMIPDMGSMPRTTKTVVGQATLRARLFLDRMKETGDE